MFRPLRPSLVAATGAIGVALAGCTHDPSPGPAGTHPTASVTGRPTSATRAATTAPPTTATTSRTPYASSREFPVATPAGPADVRSAAVTSVGGLTYAVTMTTSLGGMVSVTALDTDPGRAGAADRSYLAWAKEAFTDNLERTSRAALRIPDGRVVLGTNRGELVIVDPRARSLAIIPLPAAAGGDRLDVLDLTYDAPTDRLLVATRSPQVGTGAGQVLALACVVDTTCPGGRTWRTLMSAAGDSATDHTLAWAVATWGGAVFMGSGNGAGRLTVRQLDGATRVLWPAGMTRAARVIQARVAGDYLYASYAPATGEPQTAVFQLRLAGNRVVATQVATLAGGAVLSPAGAGAGGPTALGSGAVIFRGPDGALTAFDPQAPATARTRSLSAAAVGQVPVTSCWVAGRDVCVTYHSDGTLVVSGLATPSRPGMLTKTIAAQGIRGPIIDTGRRRLAVIALGPPVGNDRHVLAAASFFSPFLIDIDPRFPDRPSVLGVDCAGQPRQVESLTATSTGLLVMGTYPGAQLALWDPARPMSCATGTNPSAPLGISSDQARPNALADIGGGRVAVATYGAANSPTGGLWIYDTITGAIEPTRVSVPGQGISAVAAWPTALTGGWVYGGTNADPSDNGRAPGSARLLRYHVVTHEVQYVPLPGQTIVSAVAFGADGLLYFGGGSEIAVIDPDSAIWQGGAPAPAFTRLTRKEGPLLAISPLADGRLVVSAGGSSYAGELLVADPAAHPGGPLHFARTGVDGSAVVVAPGGQWFYHRLGVVYRQVHPELGDALSVPAP